MAKRRKGKTQKRAIPLSPQSSMTMRVLETFADALHDGGKAYLAYALSGYRPSAMVFPDWYFAKWRDADQRRARRAFYELKRQRLIDVRRHGETMRLVLTDAGKRKALARAIQGAPRCVGDECVIVTFDIPEIARKTRHLFRSFLRANHFEQVQKSVWVTERNVAVELAVFVKNINADAWVRIYSGRHVAMKASQTKCR